jgi:hypothetical protein
MSLPVSLKQFIDEMDLCGEGAIAYLNRRTGEFLYASEDDQFALEQEDEDLPDWQRKVLPKIREAQSSEDWLELPSKFDFDEYDIMRRFCHTLADEVLCADLLDTIGGRGTFGRFKNMIHRHNVHDQWYRFREDALKQIAVEWLQAHEIPYKE